MLPNRNGTRRRGGANNGGAPDNDTGTDTGNSCEPDEKGAVPISCVEETEPCDTGDPAVDSLSTSPEMQGLWVESFGPASNPLPHNQRQETALMVITTQTGYQFEQIPPGPQTSACKFDYSQASIPSNIVALVHSHPFNDGVTLNEPGCSGVVDNDDVSNGDQAVVEAIRDNPQLPAIPMYVMDPNKLRVIDPSNPSQYADTFDRCGY